MARRARGRAVRRVVLRRAAWTSSVWREPSRVVVRRRGRRVRAGHQRRARRAARGVQRLPAPGQPDPARVPARPPRARPPRCAAPTTPGPTASTAACCKAPHADLDDTSGFALNPVGVETWGGFVFVHLSPERARPLAESVAGAAGTLANYGLADLVVGATLHLRRGGQLQGAPRELQRVLPLRPGASRAVPAGAVVRRRRRRPRLGGRHPAPRGRLDVHDHGHDHARPAAGPGRRRAHPAQGRPRLPEPDGLRVGRPRRRVRAAAARARPHHGRVLAALRRRRGGGGRLRPERRGRAVGPRQPAGLGDLRVGAARDVVAQLSARLVRADGGRQPRHPAVAAAPAGRVRHEHAGRLRRRRAGRARLRGRLRAGEPRPQRRRAGAVRARPHQRRQPRHQPDPAAQLPHPGVRAADPGRVRRLGAARAGERSQPGHEGGRPRPVPAAGGDPGRRLRRLADRGRDRARGARRGGGGRAVAAVPPGERRDGALPARRLDRAGRARHPHDAGAGDAGTVPYLRPHSPVTGVHDLGERGARRRDRRRARSAAGGSWSARTPGSTTSSGIWA